MTRRNGYEIVPGDRWLLVGGKRDFPDGPEQVEIKDLRRGEVRVRFVEGQLEGKMEWHRPAKLFAPIGEVNNLRRRGKREQLVAGQALSETEERAVMVVGSTFGEDVLPGRWNGETNAVRISELLDLPLDEVVSVPLAEARAGRKWRLPGQHQLYLARKLCARYPESVHDFAMEDLDRRLRRSEPEAGGPPPVYRAAYLLVCSWCHVEAECDRLGLLQRQQAQIDWLFDELLRVVDVLSGYSPAMKSAALRRIRDHYHMDKRDEIRARRPELR